MSRTTLRQVEVPTEVELKVTPSEVSVKGKHGTMGVDIADKAIQVEFDNNVVSISHKDSQKSNKAMAGTIQALVKNMIEGVSKQWEKKLEIQGTGYRAQLNGRKLTLQLGYSHPVEFDAPDGIDLEVPTGTTVTVKGIDKQLVGQTAAEIRGFRPPEPYKGKGIRYESEYVRRKESKKKV